MTTEIDGERGTNNGGAIRSALFTAQKLGYVTTKEYLEK
jgi:hypothetical protein